MLASRLGRGDLADVHLATADGRKVMAGSLDGYVKLWDFDRDRAVVLMEHKTNPYIKAVALAPDGSKFAFGLNPSLSVERWDISSPRVTFLR